MQCDYFDAGVCRSCAFMGEPYADQLARKQRDVTGLLKGWAGLEWLPAFTSLESHFRNKAKLAVGGTTDSPTLGILNARMQGVDLRECGLYEEGLAASFEALGEFVRRAGLTPFDVTSGRGELKHVVTTTAPDGALIVRFVLRSTEALPRIRKHLGWLQAALPEASVVTVNLLPERKAVTEGHEEIVLTEQGALPMRLGARDNQNESVTLHLRPQSFFQTNTTVAEGLYTQARQWVDGIASRAPLRVWDLYCGVGGFALSVAGPGREVLGVEISEQAVESAWLGADELFGGLEKLTDQAHTSDSSKKRVTGSGQEHGGRSPRVRTGSGSIRFMVGDANTAARAEGGSPDVLIVNPPRRGIGELAQWIEQSEARWLIYSSCNAKSLVKDLAAMPSVRPRVARLFDMFPQTAHYETMVLAERIPFT